MSLMQRVKLAVADRAIASNGEELEEVAMIPCGDFLFGAHAAFFGGVLAQEIEGKVA